MGKNVSKKNIEKLKLYLKKNGINPEPSNLQDTNPGTRPQADKPLSAGGDTRGRRKR